MLNLPRRRPYALVDLLKNDSQAREYPDIDYGANVECGDHLCKLLKFDLLINLKIDLAIDANTYSPLAR